MSHVTSKGQVTIPKIIRDKLGIKPGDEVQFVEDRGVVELRKKKDMAAIRAAIELYKGYLQGLEGTDSDALVDEMRGPRLDERGFELPEKFDDETEKSEP